jgi:hypothetical protein
MSDIRKQPKYTIQLDPSKQLPPLADPPHDYQLPSKLPNAKQHHTHAAFPVDEDKKATQLSIYFVGTVSVSPQSVRLISPNDASTSGYNRL